MAHIETTMYFTPLVLCPAAMRRGCTVIWKVLRLHLNKKAGLPCHGHPVPDGTHGPSDAGTLRH